MTQIERLLQEDHLDSLSTADDVSLLAARSAVYVLHQELTYDYTGPIHDVRQRLVIVPRAAHGDQRRVAHHVQVSADGQRPDDDRRDAAGVGDPAVVGAAGRARAGTTGEGDRRTGRRTRDGGGSVRERVDRFGNSVIRVDAPAVARSIHFRVRAVVRRGGDDAASPVSWPGPVPTVTRLTAPDDALRDAAGPLRCRDVDELAARISTFVGGQVTYGHGATGVRTTAAEAWAGRVGVCQDMAHVMIAMCSTVGVAARYVSGHLVGDGASHAWVEVFDPVARRVIAIDPTHDRRTDLRYVTTAVGRDYLDVAPTSGTFRSAGARGTLDVRKRIRLADVA